LLDGAEDWRRGSESNRRIKVLQTFLLGRFADEVATLLAGTCARGILHPREYRLKAGRHGSFVNLDRVATLFALDRYLILESVCPGLRGVDYGRQLKKSSLLHEVGDFLGFFWRQFARRDAVSPADSCKTATAFE